MPTSQDQLTGRVALVTGVSRPGGIAATIAQRLHDGGATVMATGWPPHDAEMPWGEQSLPELAFPVDRHDLSTPGGAPDLIREVVARHGGLDIVVATHARSSDESLDEVSAEELDRCWTTNVRSIVQLAQHFGRVHRPPVDSAPIGRMVWFTSGQAHGPMDGEIAYAVSKGALHQMTASINHALGRSGIIANCINPGPVDTGYASGDVHAAVARQFPDGRWGTPDDIAGVVSFLVGDSGSWIRGQVLDVDGGFGYGHL
jgi:3-oxoacyl-[acyl-carrier protein] reductase